MSQSTNPNTAALLELLAQKNYTAFIQGIDTLPPMDAAELFASLPSDRLSIVFRMLKKDTAASVFAELEADAQQTLINAMTDRELSAVLDGLFMDDTVDLLEEMPAGVVSRIMKTATPAARAEINRLLHYPEDSAGSIMTSELIDLKQDMTCRQAVERIRRIGLDKETVYVAYVTDAARILEGVVPLKSLLFADPDEPIRSIMNPNVVYASTLDDREHVANLISRYDILALPIVDGERRLVGIVTVDDALDVLETEATEDMEKMAAILPSDKSYMRTGILETWKKRIPWLLLLMVSATFTGAIITHYESAIGTYAVLTAFFPMLMDTGGNAGGQTSVTVIRGLSLDEIRLRDIWRVLRKELFVGVLCGATLALTAFAKAMLIDFRLQPTTLLPGGGVQNNLLIALVLAATVFCAIPLAKLVGTLLPLGAKKIGLDPAVMASPFITTIVDTVTLMIYFALASAILGI